MPTTYEIHPAIGIARVGNSDDRDNGFFIGPEPGGAPPAQYRQAGSLKRQAVRFRVFRCERDHDGNLTAASEVGPGDGNITWTVHLVNRKGAAPRFVSGGVVNTNISLRRNNATGDDATDAQFIINPGLRSVGPDNASALFDDGQYKNKRIRLGEIRRENDSGRLLVLGGFGESASVSDPPIAIGRNFAENDSWHDDVSDGPVTAVVRLTNGSTPAVKPAWVIVAAPDFAPGISNLVTLYDTLYDQAVDRGLAGRGIPAPPATPSFSDHILPILKRAMGYAWVNKFAQKGHGPGKSGDFTSADWAGIENPAQGHDLRQDIFGLLRDPKAPTSSTFFKAMPRLFSDDYPTRTTLPLTKV